MSKTALLFAGQGAQEAGMGKSFYEGSALAKHWFERANATLGYALARICFEGPEAELTKTEHAQPGIFLVGWIAFELLKEKMPTFAFHGAAGLSLGEFAALAAAGVLSFEDALRVVRRRGQLMQAACEATHGGMAAIIGLDEATTRQICGEAGVELANLNCPGQLVISGASDKIAQACELAKAKGARKAIPLQVAGAYHSRLMATARDGLASVLDKVHFHEPKIPVISNVTAEPHRAAAEIRPLLVQQVTSSVRWEASIRYLLAQGFTRFVELGPGTALSGFMKRIDKAAAIHNIADLPTLEATAQALVV